MSVSSEIQRVIDSIESPEIKLGASEAALLMCNGGSAEIRRQARQTYVALARFSSALDVFETRVPSSRRGASEQEDANVSDDLRSVLKKEGLPYFGPMFKSDGVAAPLKDEKEMLQTLCDNGFDIVCLRHLNHSQLDMLYTKILESGIITSSDVVLPM